MFDIRARAEGSAEGEEECRGEEDADFGAEATGAELVEAGFAGDDEAADDEGDRGEGDDGEVDLAVELDVAVDAAGVGVEGVEGLHGAGDEHDERDDDDGIDDFEGEGEGFMPAEVRVARSDEALGEDQVDDQEENDAS